MQREFICLAKKGIGVEICIENGLIYSIKMKTVNAEFIPHLTGSCFSDIIDAFVSYLDGKKIDLNIFFDRLLWQRFTEFQKLVYNKLSNVRYGNYVTYGELANLVTSKKEYARAVGRALAKNPFPLIIPCHRVLPESFRINKKNLGGFNCGLKVKEKLLKIENIL